MSQLALAFRDRPVRSMVEEGELWVALKDASLAIGLAEVSGRRFVSSPHCDQKGVQKMNTLTTGGKHPLTYINERNVYALVARSSKPEALAFMDWVYGEVLPAIRKTGRYEKPAPEAASALPIPVPAQGFVPLKDELTAALGEIRGELADTKLEAQLLRAYIADCSFQAGTTGGSPISRWSARHEVARTARHFGETEAVVWTRAYDGLERLRGVRIRAAAAGHGLSVLDYLEAMGYIPDLVDVVVGLRQAPALPAGRSPRTYAP